MGWKKIMLTDAEIEQHFADMFVQLNECFAEDGTGRTIDFKVQSGYVYAALHDPGASCGFDRGYDPSIRIFRINTPSEFMTELFNSAHGIQFPLDVEDPVVNDAFWTTMEKYFLVEFENG